MPNERLKKYLNDIVWWIPSRKLRDFIRELVDTILEIKEQNDILLKLLAQNNNLEYIIIKMTGGFADQLYLYRVGYSIEKLYGKKVLYDISWYNYNGKDDIGKYNRNFEILNIFEDFSFKIASKNIISIAKSCYFIEGYKYKNIDITDIIKYNKFIYCDNGVWRASIKQLDFNEIFDLDKYILPKLDNDNKKIYEDIKNCKHSVACHVRRNDYLKVNYRRYSLDENYFIKAIEKINKQIRQKLKIYFFSDDMDWVKEKLIPLVKDKYDYLAVDINDNDKGYFDFYLISNCKYQIASEGRFCETAHIFNKYQNKILITPNDIDKKYFR
ncbi:alpha-1,2-fucosyltransferase [Brachyspira aalborgi]|uniref:Alpha-1,2-fucosyltransferase n=1 Tax=Brachyspira aalborgi TaxID=29522 RepID=A0A5C8D332_9SPIR|nr:alpha-1,2-fucosyltransferase [Brachyspira aalborgi]TXJ19867.1 alpha-1,2-fucosyltransferase [Brachyspira aalborgi]